MKLTKTKPQVSEIKEVLGLVGCRIEYEVKSAKGRLDYLGPKFPTEMWHQVMSFFRWTHKEMQSESQVRLYVNHRLERWGAWAFPQEARTDMSARELTVPETPEKARERFASWNSEPSDDWLYFGTVHHHCSASAFQSSTDEQNEWNQDGLHITVGRMEADQHDLHARLYLGGNCFEPDMSLFWPIDPELAERVPPSMLDELARFQMCEKVTVDFPNIWRANLVDVKSERSPLVQAAEHEERWGTGELEIPLVIRLESALEEITQRCAANSIGEGQWEAALKSIASNLMGKIIVEACVDHGVTPEELLDEMGQCTFQY